ncbi:hypothetical protein ABFA07_008530 [Porites harrisoni]
MNFLEAYLNDIDEFIQAEMGLGEARCCLPSSELLNTSHLSREEWGTSLITDSFEASNTTPADDIEVQIMDLKECYKKRRGRRTVKGPVEDHLADSKVTVMIQASDEINNVRAFTQRCPDAARRTHDTIGAVELEVHTLQSDGERRVVIVDLSSATKDGYRVYCLETGDILERNKWELVIKTELSSGFTGQVHSRPFLVTTPQCYNKRRDEAARSSKVQRLKCQIGKPNSSVKIIDDEKISIFGKAFEDFSCNMEDHLASQSFQQLSFFLDAEVPSEKVVFQPNTVLNKNMVTAHFNREQRILYAVEQHEIPGLMKLISKRSTLVAPRGVANRCNSRRKGYRWACGLCFFERGKKSTIKNHLIQQVCQKSVESRKRESRKLQFKKMCCRKYAVC